MPRLTQAQAIEQQNEADASAFFQAMLSALPDPRRMQTVRYPLQSVVVMALIVG